MKLLTRIVMGLVALSGAALSFESLMHLGELCGYGVLSFAYPLTLDLGAAASCAAWLHERKREALGMTWLMLVVSVVLNGTVHYLDTSRTPPGWLLVVMVAAVPPTVFGLVVHLAVPKPVRDPIGEPPEPVPDVSPDADPVVLPTGNTEASPVGTESDDLLEQARIVLARQPGAGRGVLARELGVSPHQARQIKATLASMNGAHP